MPLIAAIVVLLHHTSFDDRWPRHAFPRYHASHPYNDPRRGFAVDHRRRLLPDVSAPGGSIYEIKYPLLDA